MRYKLRRKKEADDMYSTRNIQVFIPTIENMEISSFLQLIQLHNQIVKIKKKLLMENKSISFNFSKCYNLQTNGIAYLGAISSWLSSQGILVSYNFNSMNKSVTNAFKNVGFLQKHFHNHFENEAIPSTAIDFEQFQGDIRSEVELNNRVIKYITDKWLSQNNILMMPKLKDDLKSKIFELFANALEHSGSNLGCFWCMVQPFDTYPGIEKVESGYTGGHVANPTYKQVCSGTTGHTEAVKITFDPDKISYKDLVEIYWHQTDPTDASGQFQDRGDNYRPVIFVKNDEQRKTAEESKKALQESGRFGDAKIVTTIEDAQPFYPAEDYHQGFYKKDPQRFALEEAGGRQQFIEKYWKNN